MTTTITIYAEVITPVSIQSIDADYDTARAGTGVTHPSPLTAYGTTLCDVGQNGDPGTSPFDFNCFESFISFDTSSIVGTITSVTLSLYGDSDASGTDFDVEARLHDWGPTLTIADWVAGADLGTKPLLASRDTTPGWGSSYNALTSEAAFLTSINRSGSTRMVICSSLHRLGTAPTSYNEYIQFKPAEGDPGLPDPKLVLEIAAGGWGVGQVRMGAN